MLLYAEARERASAGSQWPLSLVPESLLVWWGRGKSRPFSVWLFLVLVGGAQIKAVPWGQGLLLLSMLTVSCFPGGEAVCWQTGVLGNLLERNDPLEMALK